MQRIDENTYIDDTLVTCAEYQLFIDEMREQGKYYQPDQWTSYQFTAGQARTPIVGVRFSDAKAFCEWLTKRDAGAWFYRLPAITEAERYRIKKHPLAPLGYWDADINTKLEDRTNFTWVDLPPVDPRKLDPSQALKINPDAAPRVLLIDPRRLSIHILNASIPYNLSLNRALDLDFDRNLAVALAGARPFSRGIPYAKDRAYAFDYYKDRLKVNDVIHSITLAYDLNLEHVLKDATRLAKDEDFGNTIVRALANANDPDIAIQIYIDLYLDIFTLQERIAGRSPAFEGIRLVKEQKKP